MGAAALIGCASPKDCSGCGSCRWNCWPGLYYAAIPWSGDTGASWGRLKDDIAGGLGASMSGLPYWTQDTGGFFCGHYGDAMNNPEFLELLARWNQFAIFNPVYRWHVSSPVAKEPFRAKDKHPEYYASFTLYYDDNETYAYEKGAFEKIPLKWDDAKKTLTIGARRGAYPGMPETREFRVACGDSLKTVRYDGSPVAVTVQ